MHQSRSASYRFAPGARGGLLAAVAALLAYASPAWSQAAPPVEEPDSVIEWNFQPVSAAEEDAPLEERWAAPFAVESRGRPAARTPRPVVVLRDSVAARRVAAAQVAAGESTAEVRVQTGAAAAASTPTPVPSVGVAAEDDDGAGADEAEAENPAAPPTPTRPSPPTARAGAAAGDRARTHRVAYGETWYGLVRQYQVSSARLAAANPEVDPERLRSGTVLRIPAPGTTAGAAAPAATRTRTHTVTRGDTLFGIARRYGVSAAAIRTANRLTDDVVRLGQTLVIPGEEASR